MKTMLFAAFATIICLSLGSCSLPAGAQQTYDPSVTQQTGNNNDIQVSVPGDTETIITINSSGGIEVRDKNGNKAAQCQLCTPQMHASDPNCERAIADPSINPPICKGLVGASVHEIQPISVIRATSSPDCWYVVWSHGEIVDAAPPGCI